ncbi:MAG: Hsp20/alpha crystallin family protein [Methanoregula sp.]|jgi:HSP20 family molecular chaperone IbpA|uniref:Hsp20/alpha crystallin family protein n=1 Tax=Methanoregula sp. TaxID=2052170 RepID=UPI003C1A94F6
MELKDRDNLSDDIAFDPPIRMTDDDRYIHVNIDLPKVTEEQIRIDLEKTLFTLSVSDDEKTLRKAIRIPQEARLFKKKFSDGVLEIILEKPVP